MQIELHNFDGKAKGKIDLDEKIFNIESNLPIIGELVRLNEASQKQFRARTKNRSEVVGTTQKLGRQKGSGGARHGSKKANIFRSGGMAHNLRGVRTSKKLPKKQKQLALKHILSSKLKTKNLILIDELKLNKPKTKDLQNSLNRLKVSSALILEGDKPDQNFAYASRNLKSVKYTNVNAFNAIDLLTYEKLIMSRDALKIIQERKY